MQQLQSVFMSMGSSNLLDDEDFDMVEKNIEDPQVSRTTLLQILKKRIVDCEEKNKNNKLEIVVIKKNRELEKIV